MSPRLSLRPRPDERAVFDVLVPRDLAYFEGHFDGAPILAAVVQLEELVVAPARALWPALHGVRQYRKLRFRSPVRPGDELVVRLRRLAPGEVTFQIARGPEVCSLGTLCFDERTAG